MNKMELIQNILKKEWEMFQNVNNTGGRAACQDDFQSFVTMRSAQLLVWGEIVLVSYDQDLDQAMIEGRNLMTEKYAHMMEYTHPEEYQKIRLALPAIDDYVKDLARTIVDVYRHWGQEVKRRYPKVRSRGRQEEAQAQGLISADQYLYCELLTYSERTLVYMIYYMGENKGKNLYMEELLNIAKASGYASLEEAERAIQIE